MSSYDVSNNPNVTEGENTQSVKKNVGQEEEEEEEQKDLFQQDHVDVTNLLHLLNRSVTHPLPPDC